MKFVSQTNNSSSSSSPEVNPSTKPGTVDYVTGWCPDTGLLICSADDSRILQEDLLQIEEWANKCMMIFNTDKCEALQITLSNPKPTD